MPLGGGRGSVGDSSLFFSCYHSLPFLTFFYRDFCAIPGNLFADLDDYVLPGVPWTCFFTETGVAFHGTYWHDNFGMPMSRGCVNMRIEEAKWLFRWARPLHDPDRISNRGIGTGVVITP